VSQIIEFPRKGNPAISLGVDRRDAAVAQVRELVQKFRAAEGGACTYMMDLGDVLLPIRTVSGYGAWGAFLRDCGLRMRDSQIAIQLANARPQIEAENAKRASHSPPQAPLSIREALRLVRPKQPKAKPPLSDTELGERNGSYGNLAIRCRRNSSKLKTTWTGA
jgi:hypothetical protein